MKVLIKFSAAVIAAVFTLSLSGLQSAHAATSVDLGTADNFAILAGSTVTNTGSTTVLTGDLGLSPGTSVTGFPPGTLNGTQHVADTTAETAKTDLVTAYNDAAGQTPVITVPTELGGTTLTAGIYNSAAGTFGITGTLTLDAAGNADAVFIFKTASTLITAGSSTIVLTNGAQACNVFWQVGSSATLGIDSTFKGNILALTSITATTRAAIEGSLLARNGAVTLDTNVITRAVCVVPPAPPTIPETPAVPPLINVLKVPTPLALPDGPGSVTYAYTVTNVGTVAMSNVTVTDDKCTTVTFVSGDTDADAFLDTTETWVYTCTRTLSKTMTNTVTATGQGNGFTAIDTANATVVVGVPLVPPLIHLVKTPDSLLVTAGRAVTYTYTVTNPGTVPLTDVSVVDDNCASVTYVSGDTNNNSNLNVAETWTYTCSTNLTATTTNTGTAQGSANGLTALDYSLVTVVVPVPPTVPTVPETSEVPPLINVLKVPTPLALPDGPGSVTYAYTVTNVGTVAMSNISVTDDTCDPVTFLSGDTNDDSNLDITETWNYSCTRTVSTTNTNTVTATGEANGLIAIDTANATVVVGAAVVPPLINLVKIPDESLLAAGGGAVTYTYTVTNPGTVPLTDVSVVDDSCAPVTYVSGDDNGNDNLNVGETWTYTCISNLTATTTNTGTAQGSANGFTAVDFSVVTVVVAPSTNTNTNTNTNNTGSTNTNTTNTNTNSTTTNTNATSGSTTPTLPNTGVGPQPNHFVQSIAAVLGLIMFMVTGLVAVIKKRAL